MSIGDVKATVRQGTERLALARGTVEQIRTELNDLTTLVVATLHDSQQPFTDETRGALVLAREKARLAAEQIALARTSAEKFLKALG